LQPSLSSSAFNVSFPVKSKILEGLLSKYKETNGKGNVLNILLHCAPVS
jgi:hypothetical protein